MIKAFAAMFLNEPHRTTRNFKALKDKLGKDVFVKDHRLDPYYTAAAAYWKIDFMLRNRHLQGKYRVTRFHLLTVIRILTAGDEMPDFRSHKISAYCSKIDEILNGSDAEKIIEQAVGIISSALPEAETDSFDRDFVRTEGFSDTVITKARTLRPV